MNKIIFRVMGLIMLASTMISSIMPVRAAAAIPGAGKYDDMDSSWVYSGSWALQSGGETYYNTTVHYTSEVGNTASIKFAGTQFVLSYTQATDRGNMGVFVDGNQVATINANGDLQYQKTYTSPIFSNGTHDLLLHFMGDAGTIIDLDAIEILAKSNPAETTAKSTGDISIPTLTPTGSTDTSADASIKLSSLTASGTTSLTAPASGMGMWISLSELMSLPTSGTAWDRLRSAAFGNWGIADLKNQDNKHAIYTLAGALVFARTGDPALRSKVRDAILVAKRSLDESTEWQTKNGVLAAGRQIGAYVISADLINLKDFDPSAEIEFGSWLRMIRTTNIGTHSRWKAIKYTCENAAANWSTFACASSIAASIYLGDAFEVARSASIIRAFLGERNYYPGDAPGKNGYFQHTAAYQSSWACTDITWTGINPPCISSGMNVDGTLVEDASRGGGCCVLQGDGIMYSWEALQGLFVSAELLYRTQAYGNPYSWSDQALKRAMDFMQRSGWGVTSPAKYVPWIANARYGANYPTVTGGNGRIMSWGDWLYQK